MVQWLRLPAPNATGPGSIPGRGTRSLRPQLKIPHAATKILSATTKTRRRQGKKERKKYLKRKKEIPHSAHVCFSLKITIILIFVISFSL